MTTRISSRRKLAERSKGRIQRGFSLWELAILLGLLGLGIVAGFVFLKAGETSQRETDRTILLATVDRTIMSFVAENGRLPCPDTTGTGLEDCAGTAQKGWLPTITLGLDASAPARGVKQFRYVAYRSTAADLALLTDRFNPSNWDNYSTPASGSSFTYTQLSVLDFCVGLNLATAEASSSSNAHVLDASGGARNIAYAVGEGGLDRDGDGNVFDGTLNFVATTPGLESPARVADSTYDDRVLARSFSDLSKRFNCQQDMRSLDVLAQSVEVVNEVKQQQSDISDAASTMVIVESVKAAVAAAELANSIYAMVAATGAVTAAATKLGIDSGLCAVPIVGIPFCVLAVTDGIALGLGIAGVVAGAVAIAANTAALVLQVVAAVQASIVAAKANSAATTASPTSVADMIAMLLQAKTDAIAKAAVDLAKSNADRTAADAALVTYNTRVTSLFTTAHVHDTGGSNDAALNAVLQKYKDYNIALAASNEAGGQAQSMRTQATAAATAATSAATAAAAAAAISPSTAANIIASTQATATAATAAETAAKAAAAADPANVALQQAAIDASAAASRASIDAANAQADPTNYVANKQAFAAQQLATSVDLATQATALEAAAVTKNAAQAALLTSYETDAANAANSTAYNWSVGPYTVCDLFIVTCLISHQKTDYYSDGPAVAAALQAARDAYDDYLGKEQIAVQSKKLSDASAQGVIDATAAYNALNSAVTTGSGSGTGITVAPGPDAILQAADLKGAIK